MDFDGDEGNRMTVEKSDIAAVETATPISSAISPSVRSCSVIGQSNSIYSSGYFGNLMRRGGIRLAVSGRLGGSPSVIGPFFGADGRIFDAEYVFVDCSVIDSNATTWHGWDHCDVLSWIDWIGHSARLRHCEPIFIVIPNALSVSAPNSILSIYEEIIYRNKYYYLDAREIFKKISESDGIAMDALFRDPVHPGDRVSNEIANCLTSFLANHRREDDVLVRVQAAIRNFSRINLWNCAGHGTTQVNRSTSLIDFEGISFDEQAKLTVPTGTCRRLHAIMVNACKSRANLVIRGKQQITKGLVLQPNNDSARCENRLIPVRSNISDHDGVIELAIGATDATLSEPTYGLRPFARDERAILEVSDLLIETGTTVHDYDAFVAKGSNNIMDIIK